MTTDADKNNAETADILTKAELDLAKAPEKTVEMIFRENEISLSNLNECVSSAVWEAQIHLVFPILEKFRREFVQKYEKNLQKYLPITSSNGERIKKASELEIGQLYFICANHKITDKIDLDMLSKMRDARNMLAHRDVIPYNNLTELKIL